MITDTQLETIRSTLSDHYNKKWYSDHNFPTPYEIVKFVESISNAKNVIAERNMEWLLNNEVLMFISECKNKHKILNLLKDKLSLNTQGANLRNININKMNGTLDLSKLKLRTNYPFNGDTGNLKSNHWPELLRKDWDRGYEGIECIIGSAWALADTSNTGSTNKDARKFILPKLNWFIWNDVELFKPHATVETCTIDISNNSGDTFNVYDPNFEFLYKGNKKEDDYIFRNELSRDMVRLQQEKFGRWYPLNESMYHRNQFPKQHKEEVVTFSINKDGERIKERKTSLVDKWFGSYRLGFPFLRNSSPWFNASAIYDKNEAVCKEYMEYASDDINKIKSLQSLLKTKFVSVLFEDTLYGRGCTPPTMKFIGNFPLDRKWSDESILKFLDCQDEKMLDKIEERFEKGFNTSWKTVTRKYNVKNENV